MALPGSKWEVFPTHRGVPSDRVALSCQGHSAERGTGGTKPRLGLSQHPVSQLVIPLQEYARVTVQGACTAGAVFSNRPCSDGSLQHHRLEQLPCAGVVWTLNKRRWRGMQIRRWEACNRNDLSWLQLRAEVKDAQCLRQVKGPVLLWRKLLILKGRLNAKQHRSKLFCFYWKITQSERGYVEE